MTETINLKALADKLSTRQRRIVATNAEAAKSKDKWGKLGRKIWKSPTQTGHYV